MGYNLVITPKAQQSIDDVLKMVGDLWGMESYSKLLHELDRCFEIIQNYPLAFHVNVHYPEIRQCVVTPLNILYYQIEEEDIIILAFENTRTNPDKSFLGIK